MNKSTREKIRNFVIESNAVFTLISIFFGLVVGAIILLLAGFNPLEAYRIIIMGIFSKPSYLGYTLVKSTPLILTGLSITFAFRTGLFNIGAEGQFIVGATAAAIAGYMIHLPIYLHIPVVLIIAIFASGIWGGLAGFFKAKYGVHEVISTIMLNWIAIYLQNFFVRTETLAKVNSESTKYIQDSANITFLHKFKMSPEGINWLVEHPIIKSIFRPSLNAGIFITILAVIVIWYILNKTTLGYRLRAVGFNKNAAEYGGINVKKNIVISMFIAGSLAGLAGAIQVMGVSHNIAILAAMEGYGFDGIAVSLIGANSAFGCVWAGFLFGALKYGGTKIQPFMGAPSEVINIVIGTIVFFISMPKLIKIALTFNINKRKK